MAAGGFVHSIESFGTVDGPGIRLAVFMQGCPLRCLYCHNPDTWKIGVGNKITADEIIDTYLENKYFYKNGGITVTGGEPLLQIDFLAELFKKASAENIHTAIDTSGITYNPENKDYIKKLDLVMEYTNLVMLDIKHIDSTLHKELTGSKNENILEFAKYLEGKKIPLWIRHVVIPGLTDNPDHLEKLGEFIGSLSNLKALDVLPYHTFGESKYKELNIKNPLSGVPALSAKEAVEAKKAILEGIRKVRQK